MVTLDTSISTTSLYCKSQAVVDSVMTVNLSMVSISRIFYYSSSNKSPYRVIVALTGLPIGYSVIVALTGLPINTHISALK